MIRAQSPFSQAEPVRTDLRAIGAIAAFAYFVVLADLAWRDESGFMPIVNTLLAGALVLVYVLRAPVRADRLDRAMLLALLIFAVSCLSSNFPRQSLDSLLAGLLYVAGFFVLRGVLARESARRLFVVGLIALSALLTIVVAAQMILLFIEWWARTGWTVVPPLDLELRPEPWIVGYELTLLLVLIYPSWWVGRPGKGRIAGGIVIGLVLFVTTIVSGSRTIWAAVAIGSAVIAIPSLRAFFLWKYWRVALLATTVVIAVALLVLAEPIRSVGERVARTGPIVERASVWGPALGEWLERPLVGQGPGSFPWVLQRTDYFDTHSFAPRHPDSAAIQLVVETGVVGIVAAAVVMSALLPPLLRGRSRGAPLVAAAWLTAGIAMNTAESEFLIAAMIGWVAFGLPRDDTAMITATRHLRLRPALLVATAVVGVAFSAMTVGTVAYAIARAAVGREDLSGASAALALASAMDPGLAIYPRQLGSLELARGSAVAAIPQLERAVRINPSDDLAWRTLGLAYAAADYPSASLVAFEHAVDVQRSDPTNLLLLAEALGAEGDEAGARAALAEVVQAWPAVVASPGWQGFVGSDATSSLLSNANQRWRLGLPSPEPAAFQPVLLAILSGGHPMLSVVEDRAAPTLFEAYVAVMRCDPAADAALERTTASDRRQPTFWELAIREAELTGAGTADFERLRAIMTHSPILSDTAVIEQHLNPLLENGSRESSADTWGYRRAAIAWPLAQWSLPSPTAGFVAWHRSPREVVERLGLGEVLPDCGRLIDN